MSDIGDRFQLNYVTQEKVGKAELAAGMFDDFSYELAELLPEGREKSLVLTKLEEALFWATAAISRSKP